MNIVDPILFQCRRQPPAAAICVPGEEIGLISYRRLEQYIHNVTRRLRAFPLSPKNIAAVNVHDTIFHVIILLALARLGIATVSLREAQATPIKVDALITDKEAQFLPFSNVIAVDFSWLEGDGLPIEPHLLPAVSKDDLARIILTSGTTNEPKAVAVTHDLLAARISRHISIWGNRLPQCSRIYSDIPVSSSLGFQFMIYTLWRGGTIFFPGPDFQSTLPALEDYKVQCIVGSPGGFENLLRWFDTLPSYQSNFDVLICGGDVLSQSLSQRLRSHICTHLIALYGSTEASMSATAHAEEIYDNPGAVGFVTPGVMIQIVDEQGVVLPFGKEGLVRVRSNYAVSEYFGNAKESAKTFRDGWFYPGDLGAFGADGLLTITGREQTVLNLGGDKISPEIIELVLSKFKGVSEAVAFSMPNEFGNNEIHAMIVSTDKIDLSVLRSYCESRISRPFAPVNYYFSETLPRNDMGKIDRQKLQEIVKQITKNQPM